MKITSAFVAIAALAGLGVEAQSTCTTNAVRKEIRSLSSSEWTRTQTVLNSMNERGWIQWFAYIHTAYFNVIHNCEFFFPFHRRFLQEFENTGRRFDSNFALPYWDEVRDYANPAASTVLSSRYAGTNGVGSDHCVRDGIQGAATLTYPSSHCLRRQYNNGNTINPFYSPEYIQSLLSRSTSMSQLRPAIEYSLHGAVHLALGGDMVQNYSPNDFVFWLHHANIDRLWFVWQMQNPQQNFWSASGKDANGNAIGLQTALPQFGDPIINVMYPSRNGMCFSYDNYGSVSKRSLQTRSKKCGASKDESLLGSILGTVDNLVGGVLDDVNDILANSEEVVKGTITKLLPAPMLDKWFPTMTGDNSNVTYTESDIPQAPVVADVLGAIVSQPAALYAPILPSDSFAIAGFDNPTGDYSAASETDSEQEDYSLSNVEASTASNTESATEEDYTDSLAVEIPSKDSGEYNSSAAEAYSASYQIFDIGADGIDGSGPKYPMPNPFPFTRGYIQMHHYSVEDIKKHYALALEFVGDMNSNKYQSPFAKGAKSLA